MNNPARFHINFGTWNETIEIHFGGYTETGKIIVADPVAIRLENTDTTHTPVVRPPMLALERRDAMPILQDLMDKLWTFGIRPQDIGTPGHLAATTRHLDDMRAIVAKQLEVPLPK